MTKKELLNKQLQRVANLYEVVIATRKAMDIVIIQMNDENIKWSLSSKDNLGVIINTIDTHYNVVFEYTLAVNSLKYHFEMMDNTKL